MGHLLEYWNLVKGPNKYIWIQVLLKIGILDQVVGTRIKKVMDKVILSTSQKYPQAKNTHMHVLWWITDPLRPRLIFKGLILV